MSVFLLSTDTEFLARLSGDISAIDQSISVHSMTMHGPNGKFDRQAFSSELDSLTQRIARALQDLALDAGKIVGIFDMGGVAVLGALRANDSALVGNLLSCLVLSFPMIDWRILAADPTQMYDANDLDHAVFLGDGDRARAIIDILHARQPAVFDATGLRNFVRRETLTSLLEKNCSIPADRSELAMIIDDDEHQARLLGVGAYLAGYRPVLAWTGAMFEELLKRPKPGAPAYRISVEGYAIAYSDLAYAHPQFSLEARREVAEALKAATATVVVSFDPKAAIPANGSYARVTLPTTSIGTLSDAIAAASGEQRPFLWPPNDTHVLAAPSRHGVPSQVLGIARFLLTSARQCKERSPFTALILACEALEIVCARAGGTSAEAAVAKHAITLAIELENAGAFLATGATKRADRAFSDVSAVMQGFAGSSGQRSDLETLFRTQAVGAFIDLYRGNYHFAEELELLDIVRASTSSRILRFLNWLISSWWRFSASVVLNIAIFAMLLMMSGTYGLPDLNKVQQALAYSAVTFSSIGMGDGNWLNDAAIYPGGWLPLIVFCENVSGAIHWGLGLAQAYFWFSRR